MKNLMITLSLALFTANAFAQEKIVVKTVEVENFKSLHSEGETGGAGGGGGTQNPPRRRVTTNDVKEVIAVAKDIIALGKEVYEMVKKGKPVNVGEFTPISVVPRDPATKEAADPFDLEMCSMPVEKKFLTTIQSGGREAVRFEYLVVFIHSCSYNGKGKFIQKAIVQPISAKAAYGVEFSAKLKLSGLMNHGTKEAPIAGAMLTLQYKMNTLTQAFERNDTIYLSGKGDLKNYSF